MREGFKKSFIGDIPINWEISKLGEVAKTFAGGTPKRNNSKYYNGTIPWIKSGEVNNDSIITSSEFVTELALKESSAKLIEPNSILVALYGATAGKVGVLKVVACSNQAVLAVKSETEALSNDFLYHYLKKCTVELLSLCQGSGQPNLSKGIVDSVQIPLPPLPEQQKIADILSTVDAKIEVIDQQITETQELKKGLMQRLLTKGIGHTEFKTSPLGEIPVSWEVVSTDSVGEITSSKRVHKADYTDNGIPFFRGKEITQLAKGEKLNGIVYIKQSTFEEFKKKYGAPETGDVLITAVGTIGSIYLVKENDEFYFKDGNLMWIRKITNKLDKDFLMHYLRSNIFQNSVDIVASGSSQKALTIVKFKKLFIPIPSKDEQDKIAGILTSVYHKIDVLSEKKETYQELKKGLMQQLLTGKVRVKL